MNQAFHDVNQAYLALIYEAKQESGWKWEETRNGKALVRQLPVLYAHLNPGRRVLFDPIRNANPFFHYMEAIWMLAGSNAVKFPALFAENIKNYSDDGETLHGAYGYRWAPQILDVLRLLREDRTTRRVVLQMWSYGFDLGVKSKDLPCNTHIYFRIQNDALDMTVMNRSNDLVWGMLGANFVHMTILQEWIANAVGVRLGKYYHFTNNLHIYEGWTDKVNPYPVTWYDDHPIFARIPFSPDTCPLGAAADFVNQPEDTCDVPILCLNAKPMYWAWIKYKEGDLEGAVRRATEIHDDDWRYACLKWLKRKEPA